MKKLLTIALSILFIAILSGCKPSIEDEIIFDLILGEEYSIEVGERFFDPGIIVKHNAQDISTYVSVEGTVDTNLQGDYSITYTLEYEDITIVKTRVVTVFGFDFDCEEVPELVVEDFDTSLMNSRCETYGDSDLLACSMIWSSYLNTVVKLTLYVEPDTTLNTDEAFHHITEILARYTMIADKYKQYDDVTSVCTVNKDNGNETIIDQDLYDLIEFTMDNQNDVEDFYDATMGTLLNVWHNFRDNCTNNGVCKIPDDGILEGAQNYTGSDKVSLNQANTSITLNENTTIDLGGVSKGYISREIITYLDSLDLPAYLLNNGESNISIGGTHPIRDNGKFIIGLTNPESIFNIYATVYVADSEQLVTSGDYQKYYVVDEVELHHIIDPATLMPSTHSRTVSIIASDPALADLYSTAIFNMSIEDGQAFVNSIAGLEAIWFGIDGSIHYSANFEADYLVELY